MTKSQIDSENTTSMEQEISKVAFTEKNKNWASRSAKKKKKKLLKHDKLIILNKPDPFQAAVNINNKVIGNSSRDPW